LAESPYRSRLPWSVSETPLGTFTVEEGVAEDTADEPEAEPEGDADGEVEAEVVDEEVAPAEESPPELQPPSTSAAAVLNANRDSGGRRRAAPGRGRTGQQPSRRSAK
jgi:hypothetical protein